MPVVEIPEIGLVEFPESMTPDDISQAASDLFDEKTMTAERQALAQSEAGVTPDERLNPPVLKASDASTWERFRTSDWGRRLFGPTEIEKEGGAQSTGSPVEIASKMLEFTSPPPPVRDAIKTVMDSPVGKVMQPLRLIGPKSEAVMQGFTELVTGLPLAPLGGGSAGKAALGVFGAEYVHSLPEAREAYKQALENGDAPEAIKIATQTMLGGTLLAAGAAHALTSKAVATKTTEAAKQAADELPFFSKEPILAPVAETRPERLVGKGAIITPPPENRSPRTIADIEQLLRDITIQEAQTVAEPAKRASREAPPIIGERQVTVEQQLILPERFLANEGRAGQIRQRLEAMRPEYEAARAADDGPALAKLDAEWMDLNRQLRDVEVERSRLQQGDLEGTYPPTAEQLGTFQSRGTVREISDVTKRPEPEKLPSANQPESTPLYKSNKSKTADVPPAPVKPATKVKAAAPTKPTTSPEPTAEVAPSGTPGAPTGEVQFPLKEGKTTPWEDQAGRPVELVTDSTGRQKWSVVQTGIIKGTGLEKWSDGVIAEDPRAKTRMTFDPLDVRRLTAVAVKGAVYMEQGIRNFAAWEKAMLAEFGEGVRPHLQDLFSRSANYYERKYTQQKTGGDPSVVAQTKTQEGGKEVLTTPTPETPPSQRVGIIPEGIELTMDTIGSQSWWSRYFTSKRGLPEGVPAAWLQRMGEVRAETRGATYAARDLANALREVHGISPTRLATSGLSDVPKPVMESIQRVLTGQADINTLPERMREPVRKMREHVDALSTKIQEALGGDPMAATIGRHMGIYLNRSYRIFDDPKWLKKIPVDVRNQAEALLASRLTREGMFQGRDPSALMAEARTRLNEMLADWSDNGLDKLMRQGKLGSKDISLFMQRKDIAPEIRAVMGEYGDPVTNYIRSVTKMSRWLGDHAFLNKVKELGTGTWLFEDGAAPTGFEHKLAADASSSMYPLNGMRTSEGIKAVFENFNKHTVSDSFWVRGYFALNGLSRQAKTVWSLLTQARNLGGNPYFNIKSGHFNFKDYGLAFKAQWADIAGSDKAAQEFYKELVRYGLADENPIVSDLRASMKDAGLQDPSFEDYSMRGTARALKLGVSAPQRLYRTPDEMGKTVGWLGETRDLQKVHPEWTLDQAKQAAADRVRNEYPTYSMIPEAIQQFRKQIFIGPFVNFAYENIRNAYWTLRNGGGDLFAGESAAQRAHGAKKLGGFAIVLASGAVLAKIGQYVWNMDEQTDEDTRRFLPDWSKNAELVFLDKDGTKVRFVNYSYLNPYSQMTDPFVAALNNDERGVFNKSIAAFGEFIRPFANEQMLAGAIKDVVENRDSNGQPVYNDQDDPNTKFGKSAARLIRSIEPGTVERFRRRILPAIKGEPTASGDERSVGLEVFSEITGLRMDQMDMMKSFSFKLKEYDEQLQNSRKLATSVLFSPKTHTTEESLAAYKQADDARFNLWRDMHNDTAALIRQGGTMGEVRKILTNGGLSVRDANKLIRGGYTPLTIDAEDYRSVGKQPPTEVLSAIAAERVGRVARKLTE